MWFCERYEDFVEKTYFLLRSIFGNIAKKKIKLTNIKTIIINLKSFLLLRNFIYRMKIFFLIKNRKGSIRGCSFKQKICEQKKNIFFKDIDSFPKTIYLALKFIGKSKIEETKNWKILDFNRFLELYKQNIYDKKIYLLKSLHFIF